MTAKLTFEEELAFIDFVKTSVAQRYEDGIERLEDPRDGTLSYTPTNETHVRELLVDLWSEHITADEIDRICTELIDDGFDTYEAWPNGECVEEDDEKAVEDVRRQDYEDETKEKAEATAARLAGKPSTYDMGPPSPCPNISAT